VLCALSLGLGASIVFSGGAEQAPLAVDDIPLAAPPPVSLAAIDDLARTLPRLHSLVVSQGGEIVHEQYYNGTRPTRLANIKSASKSVISALVGIAIARGDIPGVDEPIATYFPELLKEADPRKRAITVGNLLEMRPGLEGTSNRNYGAWVTSRNWVRHALSRPMFAAPDEQMEYSTGNTHLLSAILTRATKMSTWQFAGEVLAKPLGFPLAQWPRDPQGIYFGGNDMLMTPRQLLAFGELYLNEGRRNGTQIVPEAWVERSCEGRPRQFRRGGGPPQSPGLPERLDGVPPDGLQDPSRDREYGYGWWVRDFAGEDTCFAWGYGGQYVFVVQDLDLVIVTTSAADVSEERRGHRRTVFEIVEEMIIAPLTAGAVFARL
jgi:CubicO group peptidase (beta-lactamase class C family)